MHGTRQTATPACKQWIIAGPTGKCAGSEQLVGRNSERAEEGGFKEVLCWNLSYLSLVMLCIVCWCGRLLLQLSDFEDISMSNDI